jgi:Uma2 family endonuclease
MSAIDRPDRLTLPPLTPGQRLDRATFHERYAAMPQHIRAELVEGVVRIVSPLSNDHSEIDSDISDWLGRYVWRTPGLRKGMGATVKLAQDSEVQPDCLVRIIEGGRSRIVGSYIEGAPELMVEVARSSLPRDLGEKRLAYERAGVLEYLVASVDDDEITWLSLRDGEFAPIARDDDGLHRSLAFPGLWLDADALFRGDLDALFVALDHGLATPEHAAFAARLAAEGGR